MTRAEADAALGRLLAICTEADVTPVHAFIDERFLPAEWAINVRLADEGTSDVETVARVARLLDKLDAEARARGFNVPVSLFWNLYTAPAD